MRFRVYGSGTIEGSTFAEVIRELTRLEFKHVFPDIDKRDPRDLMKVIMKRYNEDEEVEFPALTGATEEDGKQIIFRLLFAGLIEAQEVKKK